MRKGGNKIRDKQDKVWKKMVTAKTWHLTQSKSKESQHDADHDNIIEKAHGNNCVELDALF